MPLLQFAHQVQHLRLHRDVERGRRFVAHQEARFGGQRPRDRNPLALSARELVRILHAVDRREPDLREEFPDTRDDLGARGGGRLREHRLRDDVARRASAD